jgi:uncharacterized protein (TIGR03435 family)
MIRTRSRIFVLLILAAAPTLRAQLTLPGKGETVPTFEVDTIKPSSKDLGSSFHTHIWWDDNTYRTQNTTLRDLIRNAFNVGSNSQISGGPDVLLDSRFDLSAKIGDEDFARLQKMSKDDRTREHQLMLQALLADRFGLKVHTESRELPVFDLVPDKGGPKLQPVAAPAASAPASASTPAHNLSVRVGHNQATLTATGVPLDSLLPILDRQSELGGRLVIDKTGLAGSYNYSLQWSPQHPDAAPDPNAEGPSLFAALKEQLGLKLDPSKGPVPILLIDAVSAPTPN